MIRSHLGGVCRVRTSIPVKVQGAKAYEPKGEITNPLLKPQKTVKFVALDPSKLEKQSLPQTFVVEFETVKGGVYTVTPK